MATMDKRKRMTRAEVAKVLPLDAKIMVRDGRKTYTRKVLDIHPDGELIVKLDPPRTRAPKRKRG